MKTNEIQPITNNETSIITTNKIKTTKNETNVRTINKRKNDKTTKQT